MKIGKLIFDVTWGYIKSNDLQLMIDGIYTSILGIYDDIKNCSILSAKSAIESAYKSSNIRKEEILNAINHLIFAYNILETVMDKKRVVSSFLGLLKNETDIISYSNKAICLRNIYELSDLITILYNNINEYESARIWLNYSFNQYKKYIERYFFYYAGRNPKGTS